MKTIKFHAAILTVLASLTLSAHAATCPGTVGASSTPTADFTVNANGTVTHSTTGLMWKQCNEGLSGASCATGAATYLAWSDALLAAKNSNFAGYTDWRLPNKQELESLVDDSCYTSAINNTVFPNTVADWTWTSTTLAAAPAFAWIVYFGDGYNDAGNKSYVPYVVRLVRGGQSFDALAAAADTTAPDTSITSGPVTGTAANALIEFTGTDNVAVTGFECSLDGAAFAACMSPAQYLTLSVGSHTFQVRAKDAAGNVDPTPASVTWTVLATQTLAFGTAPTGVVVAGTPTVTATSANPNSGNPIVYSSTTASVCTVNSSTGVVTAIAVGTCIIAANQAGNASYAAAAQVTQSFAVGLAAQTITFGTAPTGVVVGGTPTVTASSASPNSGNPIVYSSTTASVCTVNSSTGVVTAIAVGTCIIAANQAGNASYAAAAQVTQSFAVGLAAQTITFGTAPTGVVVGGTPTVTASSASPNSGNPIVYSSTTASVCTVNSSTGVVTAIAVGTCIIAANQAGNASYAAAAQVTQSFAVGLAAQTITVTPPPSSVTAGTPVVLAGSSSAGLPVSYTSQTPLVCSVSGSTVTTLAAGTCIIAANQSGNSSTAAAPQVTVQFTVAAAVAPAVAVPALGGWALGLLGWLLVGVVAARRKVRQG